MGKKSRRANRLGYRASVDVAVQASSLRQLLSAEGRVNRISRDISRDNIAAHRTLARRTAQQGPILLRAIRENRRPDKLFGFQT